MSAPAASAQTSATSQPPNAPMNDPNAGAEQQAAGPVAGLPVPPGEDKQVARAPSAEEIELRERIQSSLLSAPGLSYSARRVSVAVEKQDVTLLGDVRNARERKEVENLVKQIQGVRRVKNQLSSVSQGVVPAEGRAR